MTGKPAETPDSKEIRTVRRMLKTALRRMRKADVERAEQSQVADQCCAELADAGWSMAAIATELGDVPRQNAHARVQRHRERNGQ